MSDGVFIAYLGLAGALLTALISGLVAIHINRKSKPNEKKQSNIPSQINQGNYTTNISDVAGNVTINLSNKYADTAKDLMIQKLDKLVMNDMEKTSIISAQQSTITWLQNKVESLDYPAKYAKALAALAKGNVDLTDALLSEAIEIAENNAANIEQLYLGKGALWYESNPEKSIESYEQVANLKADNFVILNLLGSLYCRIGKLEEAEAACMKMFKLAKTDQEKAVSLGNLGIIYRTQGNFNKAIKNFEQSLSIHEELKDKNGIARDSGNLGIICKIKQEFDSALVYHNKSLANHQEAGNLEGQAIDFVNLGNVYFEKGDAEEALRFQTLALAINESIGRPEGIAMANINLGNTLLSLGLDELALEKFEKALDINKSINFFYGISLAYGGQGTVYFSKKEFSRATQCFENALKFGLSAGVKDSLGNIYYNLGSIKHNEGESLQAIEYWNKSLEIFLEIGSPLIQQVQEVIKKVQNKTDSKENC